MHPRSDIRTIHELQPVFPLSQWWHWGLAAALLVCLVAWIVWLYRRDTLKLDRCLAWSLAAMRLFVVAALLIYFLGPEKRTESKLIKDSRIAVLVDTSLSMGLKDDLETGRSETRMEEVVRWIESQQPIQRLRENLSRIHI